MSLMFRGNFPEVAYFIADPKDLQNRTRFKCRVTTAPGQFFTQAIPGLMDTGTGLQLVTPTSFTMRPGSKVLYNDVLYTVSAISPYIPDAMSQGFIKSKTLVEYVITCGS